MVAGPGLGPSETGAVAQTATGGRVKLSVDFPPPI